VGVSVGGMVGSNVVELVGYVGGGLLVGTGGYWLVVISETGQWSGRRRLL
jgi:hypothetical protein